MKKLFNDMVNILERHGLNHNQILKWKSIEVDHTKMEGDEKKLRKEFKLFLAENMGVTLQNKLGGIYAYFDGDECLYIGKTKDIISRLTAHYMEAQNSKIKSDWHKFFGDNAKLLKVYYTFIDSADGNLGEGLRIVVERLLLILSNPKFERFHKSTK